MAKIQDSKLIASEIEKINVHIKSTIQMINNIGNTNNKDEIKTNVIDLLNYLDSTNLIKEFENYTNLHIYIKKKIAQMYYKNELIDIKQFIKDFINKFFHEDVNTIQLNGFNELILDQFELFN
jgi:ABC-type phosphate/phosphonate transport system permease subunit